MKLVVEISLYPLKDVYVQPIQDFIDRLNTYDNLDVCTTWTCTTVAGDYDEVMQVLAKEMRKTHEQVGQAIFVCKYLNGESMSRDL